MTRRAPHPVAADGAARGRGGAALGDEMVGRLTYHERWIVAFANVSFQKGLLLPEELARKRDEVKARWATQVEDA